MAIVVPAILEQTREGFQEIESLLKHMTELERVQVDFADGIFVDNKTVDVSELDGLNPVFTWEAHIMHKNPQDFLDYQICGFNIVLIHVEAFKNTQAVIEALDSIKKLGMKAGVVINPKTPVAVLKDFAEHAEQFLLMAVEPGFQGSPFIEETYERLRELRKLLPHATIEVDGGVTMERISMLRDAGADLLAAGSSIFKALNPPDAFRKLSEQIR